MSRFPFTIRMAHGITVHCETAQEAVDFARLVNQSDATTHSNWTSPRRLKSTNTHTREFAIKVLEVIRDAGESGITSIQLNSQVANDPCVNRPIDGKMRWVYAVLTESGFDPHQILKPSRTKDGVRTYHANRTDISMAINAVRFKVNELKGAV